MMGVDLGVVDGTFDGVWDVAGSWPAGTSAGTLAWAAAPSYDLPCIVGTWGVSIWDHKRVVWGPRLEVGTTARYDVYDGYAFWDGERYWETDFWLTWD